MNFIQFLIYFEVFYIYILLFYIFVSIVYFILTAGFGFQHNIFAPMDGPIIKTICVNIVENFLKYLACPAIGILVIFIILYIIYLIIIYFIPEYILFFPIRSILLAIYPLPDLIKFNIFSLFDGIVNTFISLDSLPVRFSIIGNSVGNFLENNSKTYIEDKYPNIKTNKAFYDKTVKTDFENANSFLNDDSITEEEKKKILEDQQSEYVQNARKMIMKEKENCINKEIKLITPDMNEADRMKAFTHNFNINVKCTSKSIESYFRVNN